MSWAVGSRECWRAYSSEDSEEGVTTQEEGPTAVHAPSTPTPHTIKQLSDSYLIAKFSS